MIEKAVEGYRKGQHLVMKVTYAELAEKYHIPASTIRDYHRKDPSGTMPVKPVNYLLQCCDRGYGKNRM